jgi:hypothetical protein
MAKIIAAGFEEEMKTPAVAGNATAGAERCVGSL